MLPVRLNFAGFMEWIGLVVYIVIKENILLVYVHILRSRKISFLVGRGYGKDILFRDLAKVVCKLHDNLNNERLRAFTATFESVRHI